MISLKTKEDFIKEIKFIKNKDDVSFLNAILTYMEKYDLDEDYISEKLMTAGIRELLIEECKSLNLLKKDVYEHNTLGI